MTTRHPLLKAVAFAFSVAFAASAFAGFAAWAFSQLGSIEQQIVSASGMASGSLYTHTTQTGEDHVDP